jgi:hypothetical protein
VQGIPLIDKVCEDLISGEIEVNSLNLVIQNKTEFINLCNVLDESSSDRNAKQYQVSELDEVIGLREKELKCFEEMKGDLEVFRTLCHGIDIGMIYYLLFKLYYFDLLLYLCSLLIS